MRSIPLDSIDILSKSMFETDTTAGFEEMLNLGLSSSLFKYNEQKMEEYREAVGVMKNLQVIDILNGIIENFNSQLEEANENVYDAVDISLAKSENFAEAPFMRRDAEHQWEIRVCVESNLTGDKYKTRRFTDYNYYINSTVKLQPIKGLNGTTIDFTNANTYAVLDSEELDTYVGLEQDDLNKRIDEVFGEQGLFGAYQEGEFNRLGAEFVKYYSEWMEGEALLGSMFYSKPMFPNGPNMLQAAAIAASFTGQAYIAVLVAAATSGIQMADGSMTWEQAAFQIGVSTATAAIGAGAAKLGDMAGSAAGSALVGVAVKSTTTAVGNTLVSGVTLEGGSLGWDGDRMTSWKTWAGTGIMAAAGTVAEGYCKSDLSKAVVRGAGSGASRGVETGDYSESMRIALATSVGNYLGGLANGAIAGGTGVSSFAVENFVNFGMRKMLGSGEDFSWDMVAKNDALENLLSEYVTEAFMSDEQIRAIRERDKAEAEKREQDRYKLDFLDRIETAVGGMFLSMRDDFNKAAYDLENAVDTIGDGLKIAARAVSDFGERTGKWVSDGLFGNGPEPVVGYGRVAGYEPDLKEINLPTLRSNTNAQKLINNLAAQHGVDPNDMMEILIASNGVESVDDLQQLIRDGVQLKSVENFGWEKGMQDKYYADYDKMQNGKLDINASLRQAELATHPETVRLYNKQHGQEDELNLTPGMRVSRGDATGDPELEVISYINDNYNQRGMSGVEGMQIMRLDVGDGTQVELVVNRAYWAQKNENEHPTYETDDGEYYQLSENENTKLTSRQGITKPHNEFYPYKIDTNGKEDEIFLHSGFQSEGCFVTGGRLSRPDNNSIRFNQYIRQAIGSNSYLKTTHRVIDVRSRDLKKRYPLP